MQATLEVYDGQSLIFSSNKHWLHPLLDLEEYLPCVNVAVGSLELQDKIVGKASAMLIVRMGFRCIHAGTMSRLAADFLETKKVGFTYDTLVHRIACQTEDLLENEDDPDIAHDLVRRRARR